MSLDEKDATAAALRVDNERAHYVEEYLGCDVRDGDGGAGARPNPID
jgi:hypothetical protein